jgi:flagellar biosynthetic protein FliP
MTVALLMAAGVSAGAQTASAPLENAFWVHAPAVKTAVRVPHSVPAALKPTMATAPAIAAPMKAAKPLAPAAGELLSAVEKPGAQSTPWAIVIGLTLLTLLPAILLAMTPMVRLLVVFHFLRQALGTQTAPSNQVLMGLALMMTWFLMQPVMVQVDQQALTPYRNGQLSATDAIDRGAQPVKQYMLKYAREKDLAVFVSASHSPRPAKAQDLPMAIVAPAYILSELKAGFQIGAVLFLPFLLIDFLVASVTTSIGMLQLSPMVISTPVKILLFVMVDGWTLLADQLLKSF